MVPKENFKENNKLDKIIQKVNKSDISSIRKIVIRLITVINDPKFSAKDLKNIIEKDPPLAARLLRLVNSAYYGLSRKISEIQEAIIRIGFVDVIELALSQKVCEIF